MSAMPQLAKQLGSIQSAVGYAVDRGSKIVNKGKIKLIK
jgi:hypothetical protein